MSFPQQIPAILLMGGCIKDLTPGETETKGKGYIDIGGRSMSALTLEALRKSRRVGRITLVTPQHPQKLEDEWKNADASVPAGLHLSDSLFNGLDASRHEADPILIVAGDLPFLTPEAVDDFIERCSRRADCSVWYGFLSQKNSRAKYPTLRHTWGKVSGQKYCGTGLNAMRSDVVDIVRNQVSLLTTLRKNVWGIAKALGFSTIFRLLCGTLTINQAEEALSRCLKAKTCGIESPFAEVAFNVDHYGDLVMARQMIEEQSSKQHRSDSY